MQLFPSAFYESYGQTKYLNVEEDITIDCRIGEGSGDLRSLYDTQKGLTNDTSFVVSYAPFPEIEKITLEATLCK